MLTFLVGGLAVSAAGSFHISLKKATINIGDDNRLELEVEGLTADDKNRDGIRGMRISRRWTRREKGES